MPIPLETKANSQKTGEDRDEDTISRSCLLNYHVATAEVVKVQASDLNGKFLVAKGKHSGSRTGDWKTDMELKPFSPPAAAPAASSGGGTGSGGGSGGRAVGDIVNFIGTRHYVSSTGNTGYNCKPGEARITLIAPGAAHPYHLVHTTGSASTVYGWVNESDIA